VIDALFSFFIDHPWLTAIGFFVVNLCLIGVYL